MPAQNRTGRFDSAIRRFESFYPSQPVVVNPAIWWRPQEVPHSRPYSGRNRTGEGAGAVRFALDRLVISARPIPVRFGVGDRVS